MISVENESFIFGFVLTVSIKNKCGLRVAVLTLNPQPNSGQPGNRETTTPTTTNGKTKKIDSFVITPRPKTDSLRICRVSICQ